MLVSWSHGPDFAYCPSYYPRHVSNVTSDYTVYYLQLISNIVSTQQVNSVTVYKWSQQKFVNKFVGGQKGSLGAFASVESMPIPSYVPSHLTEFPQLRLYLLDLN